MHAELTADNMASVPNMARQPIVLAANSTGAVAAKPPSAPAAMVQPFSVASRSSGNHSVNAFIDPIRQADTPMPISARPSVS